MPDKRIHIVHIVYRFSTGGLENVVIQLINNLPRDQFRHTVVALTDIDLDFAARIKADDVKLISLMKLPGHTLQLFPKAFRLFRQLRPDVVHSCNLAAMELLPVAAASGVSLRIHAEHGWDMGELEGKNWKYRLIRKLHAPFINEFVAVSQPLFQYMEKTVGIPAKHLHLIYNGVDTDAFHPRRSEDPLPPGFPFARESHWTIGMVGRLVEIKNPLLLVEAMSILANYNRPGADRIRLAIIGDGPLANEIEQRMELAGIRDRLWLPGTRSDIADILRAIDCFVLPSLSEATSCTLQEAMASGLDIIATNVGGNPDLLENGELGSLVPSNDASALANAIYEHYERFATDASYWRRKNARERVQEKYSLDATLTRYAHLFSKAQGHTLPPAQRSID